MQGVAVGIFCKTPVPGLSKTRLSPPLRPEECATLSACFIRDLATTIARTGRRRRCHRIRHIHAGRYESAHCACCFRPISACCCNVTAISARGSMTATRELLRQPCGGILVNADSPTLPASILRAAVDATRRGGVVLSPALDGGYTLIGLARLHERLFADIPWSTSGVHQTTVERAAEIGMPVINVPGWYDVDDAASLALLAGRARGRTAAIRATGLRGAAAPVDATRIWRRATRRCAPDRPDDGAALLAVGACRADRACSRRLRDAGLRCGRSPWIIRTFGYGVFIPAAGGLGTSDDRGDKICRRICRRAPASSSCLASRLQCGWCSSARSRSSRPISIATSGTAACRPQASILTPTCRPTRARRAARRLDLSAHQPRRLCGDRLSADRRDVLSCRHAYRRETLTAMRLAMVACEIVDRRGPDRSAAPPCICPATAVVAYAWHPLAIWEIANNGHVEALMVALMMLGVWLLVRAQRVAGAFAVALAVLVKPYAVFVLPAFWRRWDWRVPFGDHRDDRPLLSALSRCRHGRARLPHRAICRGRAYERRRHLARRADADAVRQNSRA